MQRFITVTLTAIVFAAFVLFTGCKDSNITDSSFDPPTVESVSPTEGAVGTELTINGTNFRSGPEVLVDGIPAIDVEYSSPTLIYASVPSGVAANSPLTVTVQNSDDQSASLEGAFTAIDPQLSFVNSATKPSGNIGSTVIIEGRAFGDKQGGSQVFFSDGTGGTIPAEISSPDDWTDTFIVTTVPNGSDDGPVTVETEIGTSESLDFQVTDGAVFSPSSIEWTVTTELPEAVSGHKAVYTPLLNASDMTEQYVHVTGGRDQDGEASGQVLHGRIDSNGDITSWNSSASLPQPLSFHASVSATPFNSRVQGDGFLYVLGGTGADGQPISTVSIGSLNAGGEVDNWTDGTPLPEPLHSLGAVLFRSSIYISGGASIDNEPTDKVYKAEIDTLGNLGDWEQLDNLPSPRAYHGFVSFGGYLYSVGGESAAVSPDDGVSGSNLDEVAYVRVNLRTGNFTATGWTVNEESLQKTRSKHTTVIAGGNVFVSSGLYAAAGQGSSENAYAQLNSDGSVGSFAGATGSNTLLSEGGSNLFNQAGLSYVDDEGVSHVMIIGGDEVNDPGSRKSNVLFY